MNKTNHQQAGKIYNPAFKPTKIDMSVYNLAHDPNFEKTIFKVKYKFSLS
jgi:hypothetical protein